MSAPEQTPVQPFWQPKDGGAWASVWVVPHAVEPPGIAHWIALRFGSVISELVPSKALELADALRAAVEQGYRQDVSL